MVTAGVAGFFSVVAMAVRGSHWAIGVTVAGACLAGLMLVFAGSFTLVWIFSVVVGRFRRSSPGAFGSPFSPGKPVENDVAATAAILE